MRPKDPIRVLYSFPNKIGESRICYTAWQQVVGLAQAGADVLAFPGVVHKPLPENVAVRPTLSRGKIRISYKLVGQKRALAIHDHIVARRLPKLVGQIDIVHLWPSAALETLKVAARLGIPTVLERPNAHTRYAYESVQAEAKRLGVVLPPDNEYAFQNNVLAREEEEFRLADYLLCPSAFTIKTFLDRGFAPEKLKKHQYGFDDKACYPGQLNRADDKRGLTMIFAGDCAVRKGVHFALEAWLKSPAHRDGQFLIAGNFLPAYAHRLSSMLAHPSVRVLGHRNDVPELMRQSDLFVLPSIEEGFGLVCVEAMGNGAVPLVSTACTDLCKHMDNAMVHSIGDVVALTNHITMLYENRELLSRLRAACLRDAPSVTWSAAGERLLQVYREVLQERKKTVAQLEFSPS
jgi:glycosyltransferase involved in cell wall biosynthesis